MRRGRARLVAIDARAYDEPDGAGAMFRPWDSAREYTETYPTRVPPQWVVFGLPPPPRMERGWNRAARWVIWTAVVMIGLLELLSAFLTSGRGAVAVGGRYELALPGAP